MALQEVAQTLQKNNVETESLWLGKQPMQDCIACSQCRRTGKCVFDDQVNEVSAKLEEFDGIVVGSPVYFGGPSGRLTSFLDRLFYSTDKKKFAGKLAASVVACRRGGATASFERLNQFFLMTNMHVVSSLYWNQIHGCNADEARQDAEGLQTMRTLAQNMAYLFKAQDAAKQAGIEKPTYEAKVFTNFIR